MATSTVDKWIAERPEFSGAVKEGRAVADAQVGERLYQRAMGYSHAEDKIFNNNGEPLIVPTTKQPARPVATVDASLESYREFYPAYIEFGTPTQPARPFLRPAFDSKKDEAMRIFSREVLLEIDKAAAKLRKG